MGQFTKADRFMSSGRTDFERRTGRAARMSRKQRTYVAPPKSIRMERNERITKMLARQEAFAKGQPEPAGEILDKPTILTPVLSMVLAIMMGALAAMLARYGRFLLEGSGAGLGFSTNLDLMLDIVLSISIAFLLRELVSMSAMRHMGAQLVGIVFAIVTMHNIVHYMPDTIALLFSQDWVDHVLQTTKVGTLNFRGVGYPI